MKEKTVAIENLLSKAVKQIKEKGIVSGGNIRPVEAHVQTPCSTEVIQTSITAKPGLDRKRSLYHRIDKQLVEWKQLVRAS